MGRKAGIISLGCDKNRIDSEVILGVLVDNGFEITNEQEEADLIIINTCTFIKGARKESEDYIEEFISWKRSRPHRKIILAGCYVQRDEKVFDKWKEIDGIIGVRDLVNLNKLLKDLYSQNKTNVSYTGQKQSSLEYKVPRIISTGAATSYIKVSEGCSNNCSYCVIPAIRGPLHSRKLPSILKEARQLAEEGISELCLIAQDVGAYGRDKGQENIDELLCEMCKIKDLEWLRLLYVYPDAVSDKLVEVIAQENKICKYIDIPMQHVNDRILHRMNRRSSRKKLIEVIEKLRSRVPEIVIRSSFIIGFPGETEQEFSELVRFLQEYKLDRVGFFAYSQEDGTPAAGFDGQISEEEKNERLMKVMEVQQAVMKEKNNRLIGRQLRVIMDGPMSARYYGQAPDVDGRIVLKTAPADSEAFQLVEISGTDGVDLMGVIAGKYGNDISE